MVKEAIQLCFRVYSQTIITKSSSFPEEGPNEFLKKMDEVQNRVQTKIESEDFNRTFNKDKTLYFKKMQY